MENNEENQQTSAEQQPLEQQAEVFEGREEAMAASAAEIRAYAREAMRGQWGYGVVVCLLALVCYFAPVFPSLYIDENSTLSTIWNIAETIYSWCLWFGFITCFLDVARKRPCDPPRLFSSFRSIKFIFKLTLLEVFTSIFIVLWSLLLIIPGIMKAYSYSMSELILIDHPEYTPLKAITESKKMMYGHRVELFILGLSFIGWFLLCIVTFGFAALWIAPYFNTAKAKFYLNVKEEYEKKLAAEPIQEAETVPAEPVEEEKGFEVEE